MCECVCVCVCVCKCVCVCVEVSDDKSLSCHLSKLFNTVSTLFCAYCEDFERPIGLKNILCDCSIKRSPSTRRG